MIANTYIVNVEGAIVKDGRYLMVVRGAEEYAPGGLSFPGGKVEGAGNADDVLEETLRREIAEEVGPEVHNDTFASLSTGMAYVRSSAFLAEGDAVVDVVFLCRWKAGTAVAADPGEVAAVRWMTAAEAIAHPETPPWTKLSLELADKVRLEREW